MAHNLVVRNTFIDAVAPDDDDDEYTPPERTQSDPTGGRSKHVLNLGRIPERPQPINEAGESVLGAEDALVTGLSEPLKVGLEEADEEEEDDEDEDDDPLQRTKSVAYPAYGTIGSPLALSPGSRTSSLASKGGPQTMELQRLLTGGYEDGDLGVGTGGWPMQPPMYAGMGGYGGMGNPWMGYPPYAMPFPGNMFAFPGDKAAGEADAEDESQEASAPSDWRPGSGSASEWRPPPLGQGPPLGGLHTFHQETRDMGQVSPDFRQFTKVGYEGRLSVVSESQVHTDGVHRYLVQFSSGELSRADGVGFVFSPRLPCAKNIQRIVSIFVNQRGRICMRVFADIVRASAYVKPLELGDWVEMCVDLDKKVATFNIWGRTPMGWPPMTGQPTSTAEFVFGNKLGRLNQGEKASQQKQVKLNVGHLACVVKNVGVTVTICS